MFVFMYKFRLHPHFFHTRSLSSVGCLFALSCLCLKFDFVWSTIVFAEKSFLISEDTIGDSGDQRRYLN